MLDQHAHRLFKIILEGTGQLRAQRSVDHPMVKGKGGVHHRRRRQCAIFHDCPLFARPDRNDRRMRRVDARGKIRNAEHAKVGYGGRAPLIFFRFQFPVLGPACHIFDFIGDNRKRLGFGFPYHRGDQPVRNGNRNADIVEEWLLAGNLDQKYLAMLGLRPVGSTSTISGVPGTIGPLRVHSVRPAIRTTPDGRVRTDIVVEITQSWITAGQSRVEYKGGCTLLIDPGTGEVRYFIRKRVANPRRVDQQMGFMRQEADRRLACNTSSDGLAGRAAAHAAAAEPFALMHGALT